MNLMLKFAAVFAVVGLLISVVFGFVGGNRFGSILITSVVCTILAGGLGVGVYKILEERVPEFLDLFRSDVAYESDGDYDSSNVSAGMDADDDVTDLTQSFDAEQTQAAGDNTKTFGDHIIVGDIQLKNEPKLMAAAIKTLLARDDDK